MSFGVGEAIDVLALIYKTYQTCSAAPGKIKDAYAVTRTINAHLTIIAKEYPQHNATLANNQKLSTHFSQLLDCLKRDLRALHKLIRKWKNGLWGDKGWFILTDMSDVMRLREELAEHNETIHIVILPHLRWETDRAAKKESSKKRDKQAEAIEAELARLRKELARERKKAWSRERKLLKDLIKLRGQDSINAAAHSSDAGAWDAVEDDLTKTRPNVSKAEAHDILKRYKDDIKTSQLDKAPKGKEQDGKKTSEKKIPKITDAQKGTKNDDRNKVAKIGGDEKGTGKAVQGKDGRPPSKPNQDKTNAAKNQEPKKEDKNSGSATVEKNNDGKGSEQAKKANSGDTAKKASSNADTGKDKKPEAKPARSENGKTPAAQQTKVEKPSAVPKVVTQADKSDDQKSNAGKSEKSNKSEKDTKVQKTPAPPASVTSKSPDRGRQETKKVQGSGGGLLQVPGSNIRSRSVPPQTPGDPQDGTSGRTRAGSTSGLSRSNSKTGSSASVSRSNSTSSKKTPKA